jgi:eukaryotic-like serine/threonine-protein kinase
MPLSAGDRLGPYEIVSPLGAGGMGEVFRARDTRLHRDVAIKISNENFSDRFEREARAVAALNHPHICQLYDVGPNYLVMELIEGARLKGPLPLDQALKYAAQICDALDAAHSKGITHRDLKPANILVTKTGIKLLDFGLAKKAPTPADPGDATRTMAVTGKNEIVGTLFYMSPEQLQSQEADARSDIFSFGLVLYEMLTGKRAFDGASPASVIAAIMERPAPPITGVAPPALDRVLKLCLAKDPADRWQSARDLKHELEWLAAPDPAADAAPGAVRRPILLWVLVAVLATVALIGWLRSPHSESHAPAEIAFSIQPPSGKTLGAVGQLGIDRISPDGSMILFRVLPGDYYIRKLTSSEAEPLPYWLWSGDAFWAPDSQSIAFPADQGQLLRMRVPKGAQELVTTLPGALRGGSWSEKGTILCAFGAGNLYSVPASGGIAQRLDVPGLKDGRYYNPEFLSGGADFMFTFIPLDSDVAQVFLASLRDGKVVNPKMLLSNDTSAAFTPAAGGRILFVRGDSLYSQKFDVAARQLAGEPELVQERVATYATTRTANISVSSGGTIAWRSGTAVVSQTTVLDRKGASLGTAGPPGPMTDIALSPDEARLIASGEAGASIIDANGPGRVSLNPGVRRWIWSPDASHLIYASQGKVYELALGSNQTREIAEFPESTGVHALGAITPGGRGILYGTASGVFLLSLDGKGLPHRVTPERADNFAISPDGSWLAYVSRGERRIYAQPISDGGVPSQIAQPGLYPVWRGDGKEMLYYDPRRGAMMSVKVGGSGNNLQFSAPELLFSAPAPMGLASGSRPLAVNRDGSRIYFLVSKEQPDAGVIQVRTGAIR